MFCNNCGNELNGNEEYCPKCGKKIKSGSTTDNEKNNIILNNKFIFVFFLFNMILLFLTIYIQQISEIFKIPGGGGGILILILPLFIVIFCIPQLIGVILSAINITAKKRGLLIASFVVSLCSIVSTIISHIEFFYTGITFTINIILSIALSLLLLVKLLLNNNNK